MTDLDDFKKTDLVDDVLAAHVNKLQAASMQSGFGNFETLTATRELVDNDTAYQVFTLAAAAQDVELPALNTAANHIFLIMNDASSSYAATVKTFSGAATVATLAAGEASLFVADDGTWAQIGGGDVEGTAVLSTGEGDGTKFLREDGDGTSSWQEVSSSNDGWTATAIQPTRTAADDPTYSYSFASVDLSTELKEGVPVKWTQNSIVRYGWCNADSAFSTNTTGTIITRLDSASGDYDMLDTGTYPITNFSYGIVKGPGQGFPVDEDLWTVETIDAASYTQASPTANIWYAIASAPSIDIPIGSWRGEYLAAAQVTAPAGSGLAIAFVTLSTDNSTPTETDSNLTSFIGANIKNGGTIWNPVSRNKYISIATKDTYYMLIKTNQASTQLIGFNSADQILRAVLSYL